MMMLKQKKMLLTCQVLNDDTLLHIFSFLRIKDRVKVERGMVVQPS